MADIQMRFGKDMLVLSTSFNHSFAQLGFDLATEEAYVDLCEPRNGRASLSDGEDDRYALFLHGHRMHH